MSADIDVLLTRYVNSPTGHHPIVDSFMIVATNVTIPAMVLVIALRWWSAPEETSNEILRLRRG